MDAHLLTDIRLDLLHRELRPVYQVAGLDGDLALVGGRDNLAQAVVLRLLTPRGELAALGHPAYGSRLHELIGEPSSETRRNLAKVHILEALQAEPRIERVDDVAVSPVGAERNLVEVAVSVRPVGAAASIVVGPFTLELSR
jgi:phage baseplate assembly protein W